MFMGRNGRALDKGRKNKNADIVQQNGLHRENGPPEGWF